MKRKTEFSSEWRIEFARELSRVYSKHENVKMILIGGSPSRGLSDEYSDIDMVVYWNTIDVTFVSNFPLKEYGGDVKTGHAKP